MTDSDQAGQDVHLYAAAGQLLSRRQAAGHKGRFGADEKIGHLLDRRAAVEIHEVARTDQRGGKLGDAPFFSNMQGVFVLQIFHGGVIGSFLQGRRPAVNAPQQPFFV